MRRRGASNPLRYPPGDARLPGDFGERLAEIKQRGDLTWEQMAEALGVDSRQLQRWRSGAAPSGGAMLALVRLAARVPGGLVELLGDEWNEQQGNEG